MRIEQVLVGFVVASLFMYIGYVSFASVVAVYNETDVSKNISVFAPYISGVDNQTLRDDINETLESNLIGTKLDEEEEIENIMFSGGFSALRDSFNVVTREVGAQLTQSSIDSGLADNTIQQLWPNIIRSLMLILSILIISGILYLVFRFQPR